MRISATMALSAVVLILLGVVGHGPWHESLHSAIQAVNQLFTGSK